jgi:Transposase zinc-binding domain
VLRPALEVADIFRDHGPAWRAANAGHVSLDQLKVMSAIEACRTARLGGTVVRCDACQYTQIQYCSCLMGKIGNGELAAVPPAFPGVFANTPHHYEVPFSRAISLSGGRKTPRRSCGGTMASIASSFSVGSPRV